MSTVLQVKDNEKFVNLYIAFELSSKTWKLGFSNGEKRESKRLIPETGKPYIMK
ncbi:hypothetical protein [Parashewanella spongiae]|uniref:hypothetical protein n=1 Tax=Parashewanella spongiae TaxID=342950 RepID=UPI0014051547|nr:hypothetical protein [Parashewanella spongiae]